MTRPGRSKLKFQAESEEKLPRRVTKTRIKLIQKHVKSRYSTTKRCKRIARLVNSHRGRRPRPTRPVATGPHGRGPDRRRYTGLARPGQRIGLNEHHCIYAIYHVHRGIGKIYVGRTKRRVLQRVHEHVKEASKLLHRNDKERDNEWLQEVNQTKDYKKVNGELTKDIARYGFGRFRVQILDKIPNRLQVTDKWYNTVKNNLLHKYRKDPAKRGQVLRCHRRGGRRRSTHSDDAVMNHIWASIENYWIETLGANTKALGYNYINCDQNKASAGKRRRRARQRLQRRLRLGNPMHWRRHGRAGARGRPHQARPTRPRHRRQLYKYQQQDAANPQLDKAAMADVIRNLKRMRIRCTRRPRVEERQGNPARAARMRAAITAWEQRYRNRYRGRFLQSTSLRRLTAMLRVLKKHKRQYQLRRYSYGNQKRLQCDIQHAITHQLHHATDSGNLKRHPRLPMFICAFTNKLMDDIPFDDILRQPDVMNALPPAIRIGWQQPMVAHFYPETLAQQVCNYQDAARTTTQGQLQAILNAPGDQACFCHQNKYDQFRDEDSGHVNTNNIDILENDDLRDLMKKGAGYRNAKPVTKAGMQTQIRSACDLFVKRYCKNLGGVDEEAFEDWITTITSAAALTIDQFPELEPAPGYDLDPDKVYVDYGDIGITDQAKRYLLRMHKRFVITRVDKCSNGFAIMCKRHYLKQQHQELASGAYEQAGPGITEDTIFDDYQNFKDAQGDRMHPARNRFAADLETGETQQEERPDKLAYAYMTVKFHKNPIKQRSIASTCNTITVQVSQNINHACMGLMDIADRIWFQALRTLPNKITRDKHQRRVIKEAIKTCWIAKDSITHKNRVELLNADTCQGYKTRQQRHRQANHRFIKEATTGLFDFSTLYTTLPHDHQVHGLKQRLSKLFVRMFNFQAGNMPGNGAPYLIVNRYEPKLFKWKRSLIDNDGNETEPRLKDGDLAIDAARLTTWVNHLVDKCYVQFCGQIWRQSVGIPMGETCAGALANLFLFTYELEFMEKLMQTKQYQLAYKFVYTTRYIDDIQPLNNKHFKVRRYIDQAPQRYGIYPRRYLQLNEEQAVRHNSKTKGMRYLDLYMTTQGPHRAHISNVINRRQDQRTLLYPNVIKYPHNETLLSDRSKYGIVHGELHRYQTKSMEWSAFVKLGGDMVKEMRRQGYDEGKIRRAARRYIKTHLPIYGDHTGGHTYREIMTR